MDAKHDFPQFIFLNGVGVVNGKHNLSLNLFIKKKSESRPWHVRRPRDLIFL